MSQDPTVDLDKLVSEKTERGVATVTLNLENKKLGDEEIIRLAEMDILAEVTNLELGENNISDKGLTALCSSLLTKKIKATTVIIILLELSF